MATEEPLPTGDHLNSTDEDVQQRLCIYIIPAIVGGEIKPRSCQIQIYLADILSQSSLLLKSQILTIVIVS